MEAGHLYSAQRLVGELGRGLGLDETLQRKLDSLAAQCAALLLVDQGRGELLVRPLSGVAAFQGRPYGVELLAIRSGAYAADVPYLTQRLSGDADELDLWCQSGAGHRPARIDMEPARSQG
ncbi:hypothetical protein AWB80_04189 [Caballeronia pedi]|uniref:Uncharacterized protein n=2 Tax=Caballeronia pedi TaxID=1777141 RepID=A0A158BUZ3_9BURK|nr:hypothetical protein AWB80_04189 [Caballeronia pedi]